MADMTINPLVRYSPRPLDEYHSTVNGRPYGPATSSLLATPEAWNLAYLSHDYDRLLQPMDPYFTTNVRRTVQSRLDGGGPDLAGSLPVNLLVQSLLRLPAPRFVYLIQKNVHYKTLPMYLAYGDAWLKTIEQRAWLIHVDNATPEPLNDLQEARALLSRF